MELPRGQESNVARGSEILTGQVEKKQLGKGTPKGWYSLLWLINFSGFLTGNKNKNSY